MTPQPFPSAPLAARGRNSSRRFTLIELLVVLAIIMILASMLLPALQNARRSAREIDEISMFRSLGAAAHLYAEESDGGVPVYMYYGSSASLLFPQVLSGYLGTTAARAKVKYVCNDDFSANTVNGWGWPALHWQTYSYRTTTRVTEIIAGAGDTPNPGYGLKAGPWPKLDYPRDASIQILSRCPKQVLPLQPCHNNRRGRLFFDGHAVRVNDFSW